jgi:YggT family protein
MEALCSVYGGIYVLLRIYLLIMLVYAVVSWIPSIRGRWSDVVARLVEPVLVPVRRIIPPLGGLDLSFLVVILIIQYVNESIVRRMAC